MKTVTLAVAWMAVEYILLMVDLIAGCWAGNIEDHRPVVADATIQSILGTNIPKIIPSAARRLNSKVDRIRIPYVKKREALFKEHNVFERLRALLKNAACPASANARVGL